MFFSRDICTLSIIGRVCVLGPGATTGKFSRVESN